MVLRTQYLYGSFQPISQCSHVGTLKRPPRTLRARHWPGLTGSETYRQAIGKGKNADVHAARIYGKTRHQETNCRIRAAAAERKRARARRRAQVSGRRHSHAKRAKSQRTLDSASPLRRLLKLSSWQGWLATRPQHPGPCLGSTGKPAAAQLDDDSLNQGGGYGIRAVTSAPNARASFCRVFCCGTCSPDSMTAT
jgi:hypothetical protein